MSINIEQYYRVVKLKIDNRTSSDQWQHRRLLQHFSTGGIDASNWQYPSLNDRDPSEYVHLFTTRAEV
jgi:hypothetical protein